MKNWLLKIQRKNFLDFHLYLKDLNNVLVIHL